MCVRVGGACRAWRLAGLVGTSCQLVVLATMDDANNGVTVSLRFQGERRERLRFNQKPVWCLQLPHGARKAWVRPCIPSLGTLVVGGSPSGAQHSQ